MRRVIGVLLGLSLIALATTASPVSAETVTCNGLEATIVGTAGNDVLVGTNKADVIAGLGGNDTVEGGNGADVICGGAGNDVIGGGNGVDWITGGDGDDIITAGNGDDTVLGGPGDDRIEGNNGDDFLDGESDTDRVDGGRGFDRCPLPEESIDCEDTSGDDRPDPLDLGVDVLSGCEPGLSVSATTDQLVAAEGDTVVYDLVVRNDGIGSCLPTAAVPGSVSGSVTMQNESTTEPVVVETIALWLESPAGGGEVVVIPQAAGLTTDGGPAPGGCPGGEIVGCSPLIGEQVGFADISDLGGIELDPGSESTVEFRFFPVLNADDIDLLSTGADVTLAIAVLDGDGNAHIERAATNFATQVDTEPGLLTAELLDSLETLDLPPIGAAAQLELPAAFSQVIPASDADRVTARFTATAGALSSNTATVQSQVVVPELADPSLMPAIWPTAVTIDTTTTVVASVRPNRAVDGDVVLTWFGGSTVMVDDGTNGDLRADDGIWTATIEVSPSSVGTETVTVSALLDGSPHTGSAELTVVPDGRPTSVDTSPRPEPVVDELGSFLPDRFTVITDGLEAEEVADVAAAIGAELTGYVGPDVWQFSVPPVSSRAEMEVYFDALAEQAGVVGVELSGSAAVSRVEPDDSRYPEQTNLSNFGMPEAWTFAHDASGVTVAVIDTGFNLNHPDRPANLLAGTDIADGDNDVNDDACLHGTFVAGIVGADTNNMFGISGVAWDATILPVKVMADDELGDCFGDGEIVTDDTAAAIDYAVAQGADVINLSLSGPDRSEAVVKALDRAARANRVVVAAAGNNADQNFDNDSVRYPAAYGKRGDVLVPRHRTVRANLHHRRVGRCECRRQRRSQPHIHWRALG